MGAPDRRGELDAHLSEVRRQHDATHAAREAALRECRPVIRLSGSAIRALHRLEPERAAELTAEAEAALRRAQEVLEPHPTIASVGFLSDAEKEYVEARCTAALIDGSPLPGPDELHVYVTSWTKGLAEAASELRRHLLDRLRAGELETAEALLATMDDVYDALVEIDYPDAVTGGLRRTVDQLRAVLERSRGDVTTTVLQTRLQQALEQR